MKNETQSQESWMNEVMARAAWPSPSAGLHDRIMARVVEGVVQDNNILPFGFRRPGLKLSALALAAMIAGFWVGTLGQSLPTSSTDLAYNSSPYYTGSGVVMAGLYGGSE